MKECLSKVLRMQQPSKPSTVVPFPRKPGAARHGFDADGHGAGGHDRNRNPETITDFRFLEGQWLVENRMLASAFAGSPSWSAFDTVHSCRSMLNGTMHIEETISEHGASRTTLRLFDSRERSWAVYFVAPGAGKLGEPLEGRFEAGTGIFVGPGTWDGRRVLLRETWKDVESKPHWELELSQNGGRTWTPCWIREFTRVYWPQ